MQRAGIENYLIKPDILLLSCNTDVLFGCGWFRCYHHSLLMGSLEEKTTASRRLSRPKRKEVS
jgi:hypothetical protein